MQMDRVQSPVSTPARSDSLTPDISSSNLAHIAPATPPNKEQAFETPNGFSSPSRLLVALRSLLSVFYPLASPLMATPDSSEPAASSQERSRMSGTVNWGTATLMGVFAGLLYGGSKEATASVSKDAEVMLKLGSTPDKREQYRLMRDAMEKRFIRVARGSIVGGVRLGMFTAIFYGLQDFMADRRGVHDVFNVAGAGSATAAMFGLILPGSMKWRARNVLLGSVLGAGICFPLGWLQLKLVEKANEEMSNTKSLSNPSERGEISTSRGVGAAIERLEASVRK